MPRAVNFSMPARKFAFTNPLTGETRNFFVLDINFTNEATHIAEITERIEDDTPIGQLPPRGTWQVEVSQTSV